jgi:hypothetical protein
METTSKNWLLLLEPITPTSNTNEAELWLERSCFSAASLGEFDESNDSGVFSFNISWRILFSTSGTVIDRGAELATPFIVDRGSWKRDVAGGQVDSQHNPNSVT